MELQTAGVGDALVFDGCAFPPASERSVQVRIGDHQAPAVARTLGEGEIVLAGAFRAAAARAGATTAAPTGTMTGPRAWPVVVRKAGTMGAKAEADEDEAKVALLGAAPIEVVAELGRMILRGDEVLALEKGSVLTLGRRGDSQADAVDLVVGGRPWARGELVNVDGELGVRITELVRP
jgi:flagellar motor switch/type III secretory pathway protein FliN